ncbi:Altered inheritance of mitochondria protein 9, mitochondrial [Pseudocercospora fuligena]|uniref:Altered inheritance of mitochondria protein 9, mitochondrial n=1 Tax=Pseudocercospora fuligena TaxID=685502 RepID=A0A8H6RJ86_9PEZI|nr:Altered inheritance of mitochondria protein 9, mitochondrial [Pseudocercospora fuligena]
MLGATRHLRACLKHQVKVLLRTSTRAIAMSPTQPQAMSAGHRDSTIGDNVSSSRPQPKSPSTMDEKSAYYGWTRGRFVQNEAEEMAARMIQYDLAELGKVAAAAVHSKSCIRTETLTEGMHNKAVLLTMEDGKQVVAKLPYPVAGQQHFTTASEVATMEFMRTNLDIPIPKVYAWCSRAESTPVRAEYIIMAVARGVPLKSVWKDLQPRQRAAVVRSIAEVQLKMSSTTLGGYGSIYFARDLDDDHRLPLGHTQGDSMSNDNFALGPVTARTWNDEGRQYIEFDRGPWTTLHQYLTAVGRREMICVQQVPKLPPTQVTICGPGSYVPSREKKIRAIYYYLQILQHLIPSDLDLQKASVWHSDLHLENIYVDPADPTALTDIIDWQSTEVAPLFLQARQPFILDHDGPEAEGLERPTLPANFEELSEAEQNVASQLLVQQSLCVAYRLWTRENNNSVWKCFEFRETPAFDLLLLARNLLVDGEATYTARVFDYLREHSEAIQQDGLALSEELVSEVEADAERAGYGMHLMNEVKAATGDLFPVHGCVRTENYDATKQILRHYKEQIIEELAETDAERAVWEDLWPWDD